MNIQRILIPTDFSETAQLAVEHGVHMARLFKAKIFLFHAMEAYVHAIDGQEDANLLDLETNMEDVMEQKLSMVADEIINKYKVELSTLTSFGKPSKGITEAVTENNIDLVIMGTHGASGFEEFFVGSNTYKTVGQVSCPVISVQKFAKKIGFSNIVMPIDNDLHSRQKVNNVIELAKAYKSRVHLLGLLEDDDVIDGKRFQIKIESVEHVLKQAGIPFTKKVIQTADNLAVAAMNYAKTVQGDLIAVMTGHESTSGTFMGAFAKQIVNHSPIPVLSIKPERTTVESVDPIAGDLI